MNFEKLSIFFKKAVTVSMEGAGNKTGDLDERISNDQSFSLIQNFLKKVQKI